MTKPNALRDAIKLATSAYPFMSGCGTIAETRILAALTKGDEEPKLVSLRSGELIVVPLDDYVGRSVFYFGDLDPKITWLCERILRKGDTAVDIGANLGLIALRMARCVGHSGVVHAFEPQPNLASMMTRSAELNRFDQLYIHNIALGAHDGSVALFVPDVNAGSASLIRRPGSGHAIDVPVAKSGPYLDRLRLGPVRLIKIDVEGFEDAVLSGAETHLRTNPADAILFECNDDSREFADQPVARTLTALNYFFLAVKRSLTRMKLHRIDAKNPRPLHSHDILAVYDGPNAKDILTRVGVV